MMIPAARIRRSTDIDGKSAESLQRVLTYFQPSVRWALIFLGRPVKGVVIEEVILSEKTLTRCATLHFLCASFIHRSEDGHS